MNAFAPTLPLTDKLLLAGAIVAVAAMVHGLAYNAAESALRPQRLLLTRGADLLAVVAALAVVSLAVG